MDSHAPIQSLRIEFVLFSVVQYITKFILEGVSLFLLLMLLNMVSKHEAYVYFPV